MSRPVLARLEVAILSAAGLLVLGAVAVPALETAPDTGSLRTAATGALARIADRERSVYAQRRHYEPFGPTAGERQTALGSLQLDPAAEDFSFDAHLDAGEKLQLRALITVEAVRQHGVAPAPYTLEMPADPTANGHAMKEEQP